MQDNPSMAAQERVYRRPMGGQGQSRKQRLPPPCRVRYVVNTTAAARRRAARQIERKESTGRDLSARRQRESRIVGSGRQAREFTERWAARTRRQHKRRGKAASSPAWRARTPAPRARGRAATEAEAQGVVKLRSFRVVWMSGSATLSPRRAGSGHIKARKNQLTQARRALAGCARSKSGHQ